MSRHHSHSANVPAHPHTDIDELGGSPGRFVAMTIYISSHEGRVDGAAAASSKGWATDVEFVVAAASEAVDLLAGHAEKDIDPASRLLAQASIGTIS